MTETYFIESLVKGELRNEEIKNFNAEGTWSSFQKAYVTSLVLWDVTGATIIDDTAFAFQVNTDKYAPGWVIVTMNTADLFKVYFVSENTLLESIDDVYITDLAKSIDEELYY